MPVEFYSIDISGVAVQSDEHVRFTIADLPADPSIPFAIVHYESEAHGLKLPPTLRLDLGKRVFLDNVPSGLQQFATRISALLGKARQSRMGRPVSVFREAPTRDSVGRLQTIARRVGRERLNRGIERAGSRISQMPPVELRDLSRRARVLFARADTSHMPDSAALDTGVLLSLVGDGDGVAIELLDRLERGRFSLVAVPTVIRELVFLAEDWGDDEDLRGLAKATLQNLSRFAILVMDLTEAEERRADEIAEMLRATQIIDNSETEALIVAEASVLGCTLLVTERTGLENLNNLTLGFALRRENAKDVVIKSLKQIVEVLGGI